MSPCLCMCSCVCVACMYIFGCVHMYLIEHICLCGHRCVVSARRSYASIRGFIHSFFTLIFEPVSLTGPEDYWIGQTGCPASLRIVLSDLLCTRITGKAGINWIFLFTNYPIWCYAHTVNALQTEPFLQPWNFCFCHLHKFLKFWPSWIPSPSAGFVGIHQPSNQVHEGPGAKSRTQSMLSKHSTKWTS